MNCRKVMNGFGRLGLLAGIFCLNCCKAREYQRYRIFRKGCMPTTFLWKNSFPQAKFGPTQTSLRSRLGAIGPLNRTFFMRFRGPIAVQSWMKRVKNLRPLCPASRQPQQSLRQKHSPTSTSLSSLHIFLLYEPIDEFLYGSGADACQVSHISNCQCRFGLHGA